MFELALAHTHQTNMRAMRDREFQYVGPDTYRDRSLPTMPSLLFSCSTVYCICQSNSHIGLQLQDHHGTERDREI